MRAASLQGYHAYAPVAHVRDPLILEPVPSVHTRLREPVFPVAPAVEGVVEAADGTATLRFENGLGGRVIRVVEIHLQ